LGFCNSIGTQRATSLNPLWTSARIPSVRLSPLSALDRQSDSCVARSSAQRPRACVVLVSGVIAIGKLPARNNRGGTVPYRPLGRRKMSRRHPVAHRSPRSFKARPALAALHRSRSALPCHNPVALSLYGRGEPSPFLVATRGRAWDSQPAWTNEDRRK
jgi:hypothetical protein